MSNSNTTIQTDNLSIHGKREIKLSRIKRKIFRHVWIVRFAILTLVFGAVILAIFIAALVFEKIRYPNVFLFAKNFIFPTQSEVKTSYGRVNILILGKGGGDHEAPDLTDTIIFSSISVNKSDIVLISLPRDIWIKELRTKLNSVYYWGNQKNPTVSDAINLGGINLAKSVVEEIVNQPVHYAIVVDFEGFKRAIDTVGGIEIDVEREFVDKKFPIAGRENDDCGGDSDYNCRYETIEFDAGLQKMDGNRALKFVRSRNSEGEEGTDLARQARQDKVLTAFKSKIFSWEVLLKPKKIKDLFGVFSESIETDIENNEAFAIARWVFDARKNLKSWVLPEELLENPPKTAEYDNLYVFIAKKGDWEEVQSWVRNTLNLN